ncbi:MAG: hypothetical protein IIX47_00820, partial [Spirochaetaceae bacterium]|nr:hypothetical protein [Spirochaetaceae bacterium]
MKKFSKSLFFVLLVSVFLGASLFVGCRNPFMPEVPNTPSTGGGNEDDPSPSDKVDAKAPIIGTQPEKETTVSSGEDFTISVTATSSDEGTLSYQWFKSDTIEGEGILIEDATDSSYTSKYSLKDDENEKVFYFYVVITNTNEKATGNKTTFVESDRAKVTINNLINAKRPTITEQPKSVEVPNTKEFTVSVKATSEGTLSYKWYKSDTVDGEGSLIEGANSDSYTTSITLEDNETSKDFYFYVEITNTYNEATGNKIATVTSDKAKITVVKINAQAPVISIQPIGYTGSDETKDITLSVKAES